jgi:hypothetical protein
MPGVFGDVLRHGSPLRGDFTVEPRFAGQADRAAQLRVEFVESRPAVDVAPDIAALHGEFMGS